MDFLMALSTDVGIRKKINQDSLCLKAARTDKGNVLMAIVCDGMGGLSSGELASATVIRRFDKWFESELPTLIGNKNFIEQLPMIWDKIIQQLNLEIEAYGKRSNIQLGTTLTAMLVFDSQYLVAHVGDSRAYHIDGKKLMCITKDQTLVQREVDQGRLTAVAALTDPRRSVLLQCIGASKTVVPAMYTGKVKMGDVYLLCSDGFRHEIKENEIIDSFSSGSIDSEKKIYDNISHLISLNIKRKEQDNISAIVFKVV
ncbi:MAG: serine/threonine-protein phosphatase [Clostridia bacterium]|nr:serine/threonine-protein phosphatase [Clostridia bacterium]